jgi:hypothetical protein
VCCVLSGSGLCDELITRPEESYRLWRVVVAYRARNHALYDIPPILFVFQVT